MRTPLGDIAVARAGDPDAQPVVMLHGLGGTKGSFLPTVAALADSYRTLAIDLPGFGDSVKPVGAAYDPRFFAKAVCGFMDACGIDSAHLIGNSMGGRVALEVGFQNPDRVDRIVGLAASPAWRRDRRWAPLVKALRPELGLLQLAPRPVVEEFARRFVPAGAPAGLPWVSTSSCARICSRAGARRSTRLCAISTSTSPRAMTASGRGWRCWRATRCSCGGGAIGWCRSRLRGMCARRCRGRASGAGVRARAAVGGAEGDACGDSAVLGGEERRARGSDERQRRQVTEWGFRPDGGSSEPSAVTLVNYSPK